MRNQGQDRLFLMGLLPAGSDAIPQSHLSQGVSLQLPTGCDEGKAVLFPGCPSLESGRGQGRWEGPRAVGEAGTGVRGRGARRVVPWQLEPW